jgi:hypothetical protein
MGIPVRATRFDHSTTTARSAEERAAGRAVRRPKTPKVSRGNVDREQQRVLESRVRKEGGITDLTAPERRNTNEANHPNLARMPNNQN